MEISKLPKTKSQEKIPKVARITPKAIATHYGVNYEYLRQLVKDAGGFKNIDNLFRLIILLEKKKEAKEISKGFNL